MEQPAHASAQLALGRRIRAARRARGLTLAELAGRVGVSSSSLASVERGESETSVRMLSRLADALGLTMAEFAPGSPSAPPVIRPPDRPRTVLEGGVTWEELVAPGHAVEPALLIVPPGGSSGGPMTRAGENFAYMLSGSLHFMLLDDDTDTTIREGDALALRPGSTWSWHNPGNVEARCLWVEQRADAPREEPGGAEGAARDGEDAPNGGADGRSSWSR